jgi:hypothetical protein
MLLFNYYYGNKETKESYPINFGIASKPIWKLK